MNLRIVFAIVTMAAANAAVARPDDGRGRLQPAQSGAQQTLRADGQSCRKICPQDLNPCDPINFKIVDSRCNPTAYTGP